MLYSIKFIQKLKYIFLTLLFLQGESTAFGKRIFVGIGDWISGI